MHGWRGLHPQPCPHTLRQCFDRRDVGLFSIVAKGQRTVLFVIVGCQYTRMGAYLPENLIDAHLGVLSNNDTQSYSKLRADKTPARVLITVYFLEGGVSGSSLAD